MCDLANYVDDSTMHSHDKSISNMIDSLSHELTVLSKWFYHQFMVLNPDKVSLMLISINDESGLVYGNETLRNSKQEKVLGVTIDNKLNFSRQLALICIKYLCNFTAWNGSPGNHERKHSIK